MAIWISCRSIRAMRESSASGRPSHMPPASSALCACITGAPSDFFAAPTAKLAELAQATGLDVRAIPVAGDHMSHVAEAMRQSIEFFREKE